MNVARISVFTMEKLERFDWQSPNKLVSITWRVTEMLADINVGKLNADLVTAYITPDMINDILPLRELNMNYVRSLSPERRSTPVLGAWMPDKTVVLIDGSHRYMARYLLGETTIDYLLVNVNDWQKYAIIEGNLADA